MSVPYKYRGILWLMLLVLILPWAAWRFALRDTFGAWRDCRRLAARLAATTPAAEPAVRNAAVTAGPELILSGRLLDAVRHAAVPGVQVAGYEPLVTLRETEAAVHTAQLTLTGGYTDLLRMVAELESALPQCRLRSMAWHTVSDRRTRRTRLMLTLHIQQIVLKK